jgi:O-antigen/teichoic acid export membrane protein
VIAACIAVASYYVLIPIYGIHGAITALLIGQIVRNTLFLVGGHADAPIPYPWARCAGVGLLLMALVWFAPLEAQILGRACWALVSLLGVTYLLYRLSFLKRAEAVMTRAWGWARQ